MYDTKLAALKVELGNEASIDYHDRVYQEMLGICDGSTSVQRNVFFKERRYARTQQPDTETSDCAAGLPPVAGPSQLRPVPLTLSDAMKKKMPPPASTALPESAFGRSMGHLDDPARLALQQKEEKQRAKAQKRDQAVAQSLKNRPKAASPPQNKGLGLGKGGVHRSKKVFMSSSESDLFGSGGDDDPPGGGDDDPPGGGDDGDDDDDDGDDDDDDDGGDDDDEAADASADEGGDDEHNSSVERDEGKRRRKTYYPKNRTPYYEFPNTNEPEQMLGVMYGAMATFTNAMAAQMSSNHSRLRRTATEVMNLKVLVQELRFAAANSMPAIEYTEADKAELKARMDQAGFPLRSLAEVEEWFGDARNYDLLKAKFAMSSLKDNNFCFEVLKFCVHGLVVTAGTYMPPIHE